MDGDNTKVAASGGTMTLTDNTTGKSIELPVLERLDLRIAAGRWNSEALRAFLRSRQVNIGDCYEFSARHAIRQMFSVNLADAPRADLPDTNGFHSTHVFGPYSPMLRRYARLRRALSRGVPIPGRTSCSTMIQPS